ncbi:Tubulin-specific chaperone E [Nymphon striatum]|nr:Tubulin-specific chaperone E [Nymphon striatum]
MLGKGQVDYDIHLKILSLCQDNFSGFHFFQNNPLHYLNKCRGEVQHLRGTPILDCSERNRIRPPWLVLLQLLSFWWLPLILTCMEFIREVNNLMISGNNILYLSSPQLPILEKLNELNFQFNDLSEWNDILKLGELPNLERLDLSNNKLKDIYFSDANSNEKSNFFRNLKVLLLSCNELRSVSCTWKDLAELNKLQKFENLTIRKNPITDSYRFQDIAINLFPRIGNLKFHNHSEITDVDRKGSEYEYIRKYAKEWYALQDESSINKFLEEHPRYKHLISAYGLPNPNELEKKDTTLRSNLISILRQLLCEVTIISPDIENSPSYEKKITRWMFDKNPQIYFSEDAPSRECVLAALDFTGWYQNMSKVAITPLLEEIDQIDLKFVPFYTGILMF